MKKRILAVFLAALMLLSAFAVPVGAVTKGDVNNDGKINALDIRLLTQKRNGEDPVNFIEAAADVNGDGEINARDVTALMNNRFNSLRFTQNPSYPALSYGLFSVELGADSVIVDEGATSATVPVRIYNVPMEGVSTIAFSVSISGKATVTEIENAVGHGLSKSDNSGYLWVATNTGIFEKGTVIANVTFKLSGDAKPGDYYNVTLSTSTDVDDCVTFNGVGSSDTPASLGAKVSYNGKIIVAEKPSDDGKITLSAADVTVTEGAATADVTVTVGNIPTDLGLASCHLSVSADGGASVTDVSLLIPSSDERIYEFSDGLLLWFDRKSGIYESSVEFAKITVALPANAKAGDTFRVTLGASDDAGNYITLDRDPTTGDRLALGAKVVRSATITVAAKEECNVITFSATSIIGQPGEMVDFDVMVDGLDPKLGLSSFAMNVSVPGLDITEVDFLCMEKGDTAEFDITGSNVRLQWLSEAGIKGSARATLVRVYVMIPADAVVGTEYQIYFDLAEKRAYYLTAAKVNGEKAGQEANAVDGATITVGKTALVTGDANGDGKLNARDVTAIMKAVIVENTPSGLYPANFIRKAADFNGDGKLNARDVVGLMKLLVTLG